MAYRISGSSSIRKRAGSRNNQAEIDSYGSLSRVSALQNGSEKCMYQKSQISNISNVYGLSTLKERKTDNSRNNMSNGPRITEASRSIIVHDAAKVNFNLPGIKIANKHLVRKERETSKTAAHPPPWMKPAKARLGLVKLVDINQDLISNCNLSSVGFSTRPGIVCGETKLNQDALFLSNRSIDNFTVIALFDGHGMVGHRVSNYLALNLEGTFGFRRLYPRKKV